ncbi:MAG: PQQ-binding-like beta-propeller repeat protein [Pirellulales bacterium]
MRAALLLALLILPAPVFAGDAWPQFRGPAGDGTSDSTRLPVTWSETENVIWKTPIHGRGWSSPVIWGDQIWMTTATEDGKQMFAVCVDRQTGRILHDIKLFDVENPREIHQLNSYASPTPVIEEGRVYIHFGSYGTACLGTTSGEVLWSRRDLPCDHFRGPGSSPILFEDTMIVHYDGFDYQYVVALDKQTGETVWKRDRDIEYGTDNGDFMKAYSTPQIIEAAGKLQMISATSKAAISYDPRTGEEIWRIHYPEFSATARPLFGEGLVFINTGFGKADLYAVRPDGTGDVTDSHVAWVCKRSVPSKPSQLLVDGLLYMVHDAGVASCLDAKTGESVWTQRLGGNFSASPLAADGKLYFLSHDGDVTVVKAGRDYQVLAINRLDDGFMSSPAVSGRALYVRTRSHVYRIEQPADVASGG